MAIIMECILSGSWRKKLIHKTGTFWYSETSLVEAATKAGPTCKTSQTFALLRFQTKSSLTRAAGVSINIVKRVDTVSTNRAVVQ